MQFLDLNFSHFSTGPGQPITMPIEQLYSIVNTNVIGEEFQDIALCALREEEPRGHIGLWPEAALINHSCSPNATSKGCSNSPPRLSPLLCPMCDTKGRD